jgi:PAS domain S-box-containing protein
LEAEIESRQRMESKLRESEVRYRTLVESAGDAIATVREDGVILFVNGTVASQFGVASEAMIGKTMHDFFPRPFADRQIERIREAICSGKGSSESHLAQIEGRQRWFNTTFEPLGVGQASAALIIARDIDDLVRAQKQLEDYREQMTRADRLASLGAMSAMVAHELTQPLTVLRLSAQNALAAVKTEAGGAVAAEDLEGTIDEIATMAEIIERFRGFARASSPGHERSVALSEVAGHVVRLTAEAAERAGVSVSVAGLEALPCLSARPKDMEQLFFALIMNAIQAADGQGERTVVVSGQARDHEIELCFADDCGGIAEADLEQIFKPFFTTKGETGGTGLGLCVVEHILDRYGAKIEAVNRPGDGVTFKVTLPLPAASSA